MAISLRRRVLAIFIGWSLIAIYRTAASYMILTYYEKPMPWGPAVLRGLAYAVIWTAMTTLLFLIAERLSLERAVWPRLLLLALPLLIATALVTIGIEAAMSAYATHNPRPIGNVIESWIVEMFHGTLLDAFVVLGLAIALRIRDEASRRKLQAAELETELANAQMQVLRSQIQPHFLFNTLQAISSLIGKSPADAKLMLVRLSDLLRMAMATANEPFVPLRSELEFTERYLAIQQVRFSDRLTVEWDVDDDALDLPVPVFLLQPLVENSLKHGLADSEEGGRIVVSARLERESLRLTVADDGSPAERGETHGGGIGLANIRSRLAGVYGDAAGLCLEPQRSGGTIVTIVLPAPVDLAAPVRRRRNVRSLPAARQEPARQSVTGRSMT